MKRCSKNGCLFAGCCKWVSLLDARIPSIALQVAIACCHDGQLSQFLMKQSESILQREILPSSCSFDKRLLTGRSFSR
jgi:hypothetical protein